MAKKDTKRLNVRLRNPVAWALAELAERWRCSQTAVLERLVLEAHGGTPVAREPAASEPVSGNFKLPPVTDGQWEGVRPVGPAVTEVANELKYEREE